MQNRALEGLRLLPTPAYAIFYGKSFANLLVLLLLGISLLPPMVFLYDVGFREGVPTMLAVVALGT
jgi:ABC-type transport system involved in cytochrome c biogenesis permease component